MSPVGGRAVRSGRLDADVDDVVGGDVGGRLKVTCRGGPRCDGGGARTGGACATGRPLRGGLAGSLSVGVLAALRCPPSPPRVFLAGFPRGDPKAAEFTRRCDPPFWIMTFRGEGGVIWGLI